MVLNKVGLLVPLGQGSCMFSCIISVRVPVLSFLMWSYKSTHIEVMRVLPPIKSKTSLIFSRVHLICFFNKICCSDGFTLSLSVSERNEEKEYVTGFQGFSRHP